MKKLLFLLFFNCAWWIINCACSQNPLVKMWDKRFGGMAGDYLYAVQQTSDNGYILGGFSISGTSGDKTQTSWGGEDFWIVKIDSLGNKQWDKDFGGNGTEELYSIHQTTNGGFILGGSSSSGITGDKTQPSWGVYDYWIVKTDSVGNKLWDKDFGGTNYDVLTSLQQTSDGGYILGGRSSSGAGGNKSQTSWGGYDFWIVKTDSLGNKLWDKDFGGFGEDLLTSIQETADRGFILGGCSTSGISGDKTQPSQGLYDYWIVKTDSLGNKEWDKDFGGLDAERLFSIEQISDRGYILGGWSESNISGDKTQPSWGGYDFWILKTDSLGIKLWDKDLGGTSNEDEFGTITQTQDGGFLATGNSYSPISGNKTENNLGPEQTWAVKTDSMGNVLWDKTLFTNHHDEIGMGLETADHCYLFANYTASQIAGYKTQNSWNSSYDYWIVKFCDSTTLHPISSFAVTQNLCPGTCTDFLNLSINASTYQWNFPGANPDTSTAVNPTNICYANPGNYDVQLIATNSNGSDTLLLTNYITVYPTPAPQAITQNGDTLIANTGASSYQWYINGNIISGATNYFYVATTSGDYNVVATDTNGCEVEAVINDVIASIQYTVDSRQLTIFPNPVLKELKINNEELRIGIANAEISIYNLMGEKVLDVSPLALGEGSGGEAIDCKLLPSDIYYLEIISENKIYRAKFLKQ